MGGYALAAHGHPRYTKDLDIWIDRDPVNADNLVLALSQFGFDSVGLTRADFLQDSQVIQLGYPPVRIDILTSADGVEFADCYSKHSIVMIDGVEVALIDVESLCKNKLASGRTQDLADVEFLKSTLDKSGEPN